MNTEIKKISISISSSMKLELDLAKRKCYPGGAQNDMIKDLITRGLTSRVGKEHPKQTC